MSIDEASSIPYRPSSSLATSKDVRLNKKYAAITADRLAKAEAKAIMKATKQADCFRRIFSFSCNYSTTFNY